MTGSACARNIDEISNLLFPIDQDLQILQIQHFAEVVLWCIYAAEHQTALEL